MTSHRTDGKSTAIANLSPGQVWEDFVNGSVGHVFVDRVAGLAQGEGEVVTHAQQLAEADQPVLWLDAKILHSEEEEEDKKTPIVRSSKQAAGILCQSLTVE